MEKRRTKLMQAYVNLTGDYPLDSINAVLLKEELEMVMDTDLSDDDFLNIINENAKVYRIFLIKYRPGDHPDYLVIEDKKVGEISVEPKEEPVVIDDILYY